MPFCRLLFFTALIAITAPTAAQVQSRDIFTFDGVAAEKHTDDQLAVVRPISRQTQFDMQALLEPDIVSAPQIAGGSPPAGRYTVSIFRKHTHSVKWEIAGAAAAMTATRIGRVVKNGPTFGFKSEGWFGKSTTSLGMDKVHHAYKTYVIADVMQGLIQKRSNGDRASVTSGALIGLGLMTYGELFDGLTKGHGWSNEDMTVHLAGAGFAMLRNNIPGMRDKLDFRMLTMPTFRGDQTDLVNLLAQRKYLLAVQLDGFERFERTPLRYVELHLGYYGRGFTDRERALGAPLKRNIYVGVGLNLQQFWPKKPKSMVARLSKGTLDYIQLPYTSVQ
jgi:uncharacterized protein YfiM (DUF2279 family)